MKPDMSKSTAISDISSPSFLTPTTLKNITQILESEECMKSIQTFEETGNADKVISSFEAQERPKTAKSTSSSNIRTRSGNTYFSLDSKSWQVGIIASLLNVIAQCIFYRFTIVKNSEIKVVMTLNWCYDI